MALLQWILGKLANSASTLLNALFGWAVLALFGQSSRREKTLLTGLVAAAAAWPVLVVAALLPRLAAEILLFIPLPPSVPKWTVSFVWIALAMLVPVTVGVVFAGRAPPGTPQEPGWKRILRGVPITLGLAGAFWMMLVIAPVVRLMSILGRLTDEHLTVLPLPGRYREVALALASSLGAHALPVDRVPAPWWLTAPTRVLVTLGGAALRGYAVSDLACFQGPQLQLVFYPGDLLIRGKAQVAALAHSLVAEQLAPLPAYQTLDPNSQRLEGELKRIWSAFATDPVAHQGSPVLSMRLREVANELVALRLPFEAWGVVYRQMLQLGRALGGEAPLLSAPVRTVAPAKVREAKMEREAIVKSESDAKPGGVVRPSKPEMEALTTTELVKQIATESRELAQSELKLARAEITEDLKREIGAAKGLGVSAILALASFNALLMAATFALSLVMPGWAAALVVAAATLLSAGVVGAVSWSRRLSAPLARTRRTLEEDLQWAKNRLA